MRRILVVMAFWVLLMAAKCGSDQISQKSQDQLPETIKMIKTPCKGTCPVYELEVSSTGYATLLGKKHFDHIGRFQRQLASEEIEALISEWNEDDFFQLDDEYALLARDLPVTYIEVIVGDKSKQVRFDRSGPESLQSMEELLSGIAVSGSWIKFSE